MPAPVCSLQIKVKTLTGKEIEIDIESDDSIARIKERVEEKEGIPPPQQRLIFGGKQMSDDKKAMDYNVCSLHAAANYASLPSFLRARLHARPHMDDPALTFTC